MIRLLALALLVGVGVALVLALQRRRRGGPEVLDGEAGETRWLNSDVRAIEMRLHKLETEIDELKRRLGEGGR